MHIAANGSFRPANCPDFFLTDQQAFSTERGQPPELLHSLGPLRTLVTTAANGNKEPILPNAAECTNVGYHIRE